jgi:hypothetical protein
MMMRKVYTVLMVPGERKQAGLLERYALLK